MTAPAILAARAAERRRLERRIDELNHRIRAGNGGIDSRGALAQVKRRLADLDERERQGPA